ncbi:MAG: 2-oxo acid dehydrogenase subunit E2 [Candidatus Hydrogenedentota bacterium]
MATTFSLPELGENIDSGTVTAVLVKVGDTVAVDDPVVELETDKAVVEVPCAIAGIVTEIQVEEGATLSVGQGIIVLDADGSAPAKSKSEPEPAAKPEKTPAPIPPPVVASAPEPKPESKPEPAPEPVPYPEPATAPAAKQTGPVRAAPSVRKLAREIGVAIGDVTATDPDRGISAADVKAHAKKGASRRATPTPAASASAPGAAPLPNFERWGAVRRESMSTIRRITMESMTRSWTTVPHVTQNDKADVTELEKFRKAYGGPAQAAGGKLTLTSILVKVLSEALKRFPQFNCSIDPASAEIIYKEFFNIGIAVDTEHGLMVPSIKNVDKKGLVDIAVELTQISERARTRKIGLDELQGSCMTITNLGGIGGTSFTPIINAPEVAILGVSRSRVEPVFIDGEFVPRTLMPLSLSYDHRIIDGADAARFTRWVCEALESPMNLMMDV